MLSKGWLKDASKICFGKLSTAYQPCEPRARGSAFGVDDLPFDFKPEQLPVGYSVEPRIARMG
jgi:hypothetical protein